MNFIVKFFERKSGFRPFCGPGQRGTFSHRARRDPLFSGTFRSAVLG
jgi:hypothetical protein